MNTTKPKRNHLTIVQVMSLGSMRQIYVSC